MQPNKDTITEIPIDKIDEPPILLHPETDLASLEELATSIKTQGLIQPIVVRPKGERYQLIAGYRRYLAARKFGIPTIAARIIQMDEAQALEASATENIQRTDLDPVAEGQLYHTLITQHGRTIREIANKLGKSETYIKARIDLLDMPEPIQNLARTHKLQLGIIPHLKTIKDPEDQILIAADIAKRGFTVEDSKHIIESFNIYKEQLKQTPPQQILEKAKEEPLTDCPWCGNQVKLKTLRQQLLCDECYRRLMWLDETHKRTTKTQPTSYTNPPPTQTPTPTQQ